MHQFYEHGNARSAMRAKESDCERWLGGQTELIGQSWEAFLMTLIAVLLSVAAVYLLLPAVKRLSGKNLQLLQSIFLAALGRHHDICSPPRGSYPSLSCHAFKPAETLKGTFRNSARAWTA